MLDDIMKASTEPEKHQVLQFETRSLRDTRQLLNTVSIADTMQFIEQNPHPRCSSLLLAQSLLPHSQHISHLVALFKEHMQDVSHHFVNSMNTIGRLTCWVIPTTTPRWMNNADFKQHYMDRGSCQLLSTAVPRSAVHI